MKLQSTFCPFVRLCACVYWFSPQSVVLPRVVCLVSCPGLTMYTRVHMRHRCCRDKVGLWAGSENSLCKSSLLSF